MAFFQNLRNRASSQERERGAVLVLTALVMLLLLFIAAFATDLGAWYRQGQEQQRAADVGALNGVQAYDRGVKEYWATVGAQRWDQLTPAQATLAEEAGLREAANTVIALMETTGLTFSNPGSGVLASDPLAYDQTSVWTVVADDGTQVLITRSWVVTGADASGNPTYSRAIDVEVIASGEQYFSNIVREAPEIERSASSVLSNCGAVCSTPIELIPPFRGFDAKGNGDGWVPLLRGGVNGDEIWAVNHHSNSKPNVGSIVCMDRNTESFCDFTYPGAPATGRIPLTDIRTHTRPTDYLDEARDKIFFTAGRFSTNQSGLFCFDMAARDWCSVGFLPLFDMDVIASWDTNAVGPVEHNDLMYIMGHHGELVCVTPNMTECGRNTLPVASLAVPDENARGKTNNMELVGNELFMTFELTNGTTAFDCWNLATAQACWSGAAPTSAAPGTGNKRFTFLEYSPTGVPESICVINSATGGHACADVNNGNISDLGNTFKNHIDNGSGSTWVGDSFAIDSAGVVRTFFGAGRSNKTLCWDWKTDDVCNGDGVIKHVQLIEPYAYVQVSDDCILGLGDEATFFTLTIDTLETCTGSSVSTSVTPCDCADGDTRYGVLDLPQALKDDLSDATATVIGEDADGNYLELTGDLLDLPMDLSPFNGFAGPLDLTIEVNSKVIGGVVQWDETYEFDLELTVQPTLTS